MTPEERKEYNKIRNQLPEVKAKRKIDKNTHRQCECGGSYLNKHKAEHFRTNKHNKYIEYLKLIQLHSDNS